MKVLTRTFVHSQEFGSQAKVHDGEKTVVYKPIDKDRVLNGIYSFIPVVVEFSRGNFSIVRVEIVRPLVPVGTILEVTFRIDADGVTGSATHAGNLVKVIPSNKKVVFQMRDSKKFLVRVERITTYDNLTVIGEIKAGITTKRGRITSSIPAPTLS